VSLPVFVVFAALVWLAYGSSIPADRLIVKDVVDGDTVELSDGRTVRYIGIDTPETRRKTDRGWVSVRERFGYQAKQLNKELVWRRPVRLEYDVVRKDKFGRDLAYCFVERDGQEVLVARELVRNGLAYIYTIPPNVRYVDLLVQDFHQAREAKRGIWAVPVEIPTNGVAGFVGERKMVVGEVGSVRASAKTIRLSMGDEVTVVISQKDRGLFEKAGISPESYYERRRVRVFGLIRLRGGHYEISVSHPSQIEVLSSEGAR
jgi:micrococcal nuclease